ncbi:unnamed protein product [Pieris macdunnoughi]|uniref:Uncharacterized protein n=1 Tax=Pieris macdunnoughi TaxID=345717 RepID=A0A821WWV5_9NEOP|nr:unnamed protein product [Pieris macdunnoughi]
MPEANSRSTAAANRKVTDKRSREDKSDGAGTVDVYDNDTDLALVVLRLVILQTLLCWLVADLCGPRHSCVVTRLF